MGPSHQAEEIANPLLAPPLENAMAGRNVVAERYDSDLVPGGTPFLSRAMVRDSHTGPPPLRRSV